MGRSRLFRLLLTGVIGSFAALSLAPAAASSANISHSYESNQQIPNGSLVSLSKAKSSFVELANFDNGPQLIGISVGSDDSLLAVEATSGKAQIATSGTATALVSDLNGNIEVGDQVSVSPFNGIGAKAITGAYSIGQAQTAFNADDHGTRQVRVTDKNGKQKQLNVGYIRINIAVSAPSGDGSESLNALQKIAKSLTGHTVSTTRVVISLIIALVTLMALVTLIYASIYGGIISIGRNPLAKYAIFRTLGAVLGMTGAMAGVATVIIFLLLR
jgi:hypothetical protein